MNFPVQLPSFAALRALSQGSVINMAQAQVALSALPKGPLLNLVQAGALLHVITRVGMQKAGCENTNRNQMAATFVVTVITSAASHVIKLNAYLTAAVALITLLTGFVAHKVLGQLLAGQNKRLSDAARTAHQARQQEVVTALTAAATLVKGSEEVPAGDAVTIEALIAFIQGRIEAIQEAHTTEKGQAKVEVLTQIAELVEEEATIPTNATAEMLVTFVQERVKSSASRKEELELAIGSVRAALQDLNPASDIQANTTPQELVAILLEKANEAFTKLKELKAQTPATALADATAEQVKLLKALVEKLRAELREKAEGEDSEKTIPAAAGSENPKEATSEVDVEKLQSELVQLTQQLEEAADKEAALREQVSKLTTLMQELVDITTAPENANYEVANGQGTAKKRQRVAQKLAEVLVRFEEDAAAEE